MAGIDQRLAIIEIAVTRRIVGVFASASSTGAESRKLHHDRARPFQGSRFSDFVAPPDRHTHFISIIADEVNCPSAVVVMNFGGGEVHLSLPFVP